jgi:hypothetical protein
LSDSSGSASTESHSILRFSTSPLRRDETAREVLDADVLGRQAAREFEHPWRRSVDNRRIGFNTVFGALGRPEQRRFLRSITRSHRAPVRAARTRDAATGAAADRVLKWYAGFAEGEGAVAEVKSALDDLKFGVGHTIFEGAVELVGNVIGALSTRPERDEGQGPDNLWRWKDANLVIECKSRSDAESISKRYLGQIRMSTDWFEREFPGAPVTPVMVIDTKEADADAEERLRVITSDGLKELRTRVLSFVQSLSKKPAGEWTRPTVAAALDECGLTPAKIVEGTMKTPRRKRSG